METYTTFVIILLLSCVAVFRAKAKSYRLLGVGYDLVAYKFVGSINGPQCDSLTSRSTSV